MAPRHVEFDHPRHTRVSLGAALILSAALGLVLLQVAAGRVECGEATCASPSVQAALRSF